MCCERLNVIFGVRLLNPATRGVAPTEAGERLVVRLRPALPDLQAALGEAACFGELLR
jgi:DNA-binding transcriptional LysR family regulator